MVDVGSDASSGSHRIDLRIDMLPIVARYTSNSWLMFWTGDTVENEEVLKCARDRSDSWSACGQSAALTPRQPAIIRTSTHVSENDTCMNDVVVYVLNTRSQCGIN